MTALQPTPNGQILTVFAARDGHGKTTFASNLSVVLNSGGTRRVCLVDLDFVFGDVATMLGAKHAADSLVDVAKQGPLHASTIPALVTPIGPALDGVLVPDVPGYAAAVPPALVGELLANLPSAYEYVVVDTPTGLSPHVLMALDMSHHHVLLTTPERPALRDLRLTLDMLDLLSYSRALRLVVLNRVDSRVGLAVDNIQQAIKTWIAGKLPSSRDVPASINRGVPISLTEPAHAFSRAVTRFAKMHITGHLHSASIADSADIDELRWQW